MADSFKIQGVQGEFIDFTDLETVAELIVTMTLEPSDNTDVTNFLFSEAAEDNGIAGVLDGNDGLIYDGPPGNYVHVQCAEVEIAEGTIAPANTDLVVPVVVINSVMFDTFNTEDARRVTDGGGAIKVVDNEETKGSGFVAEIDTAIVVEFHYEGIVGPLNSGDVIRFGLLSGNEGTVDWDNEEGSGTWSIT